MAVLDFQELILISLEPDSSPLDPCPCTEAKRRIIAFPFSISFLSYSFNLRTLKIICLIPLPLRGICKSKEREFQEADDHVVGVLILKERDERKPLMPSNEEDRSTRVERFELLFFVIRLLIIPQDS